jgi:hypothetical protein
VYYGWYAFCPCFNADGGVGVVAGDGGAMVVMAVRMVVIMKVEYSIYLLVVTI